MIDLAYSGWFLVLILKSVLRMVSVAQNHSVSSVPKVFTTTVSRVKKYFLSSSLID